jgi:hypothetical protein
VTAARQRKHADWYFGNPSAMSMGQTEFRRIWGTFRLEDNWRRSLRSASTTVVSRNAPGIDAPKQDQEEKVAPPPADPVEAEFMRISKQIQKTDEQKKEALKKIEDAYFNLGDIYYFKLQEKDNAVASYNKLLERFLRVNMNLRFCTKLYLIYKDSDPAKSESYATLLKEKHPGFDLCKDSRES